MVQEKESSPLEIRKEKHGGRGANDPTPMNGAKHAEKTGHHVLTPTKSFFAMSPTPSTRCDTAAKGLSWTSMKGMSRPQVGTSPTPDMFEKRLGRVMSSFSSDDEISSPVTPTPNFSFGSYQGSPSKLAPLLRSDTPKNSTSRGVGAFWEKAVAQSTSFQPPGINFDIVNVREFKRSISDGIAQTEGKRGFQPSLPSSYGAEERDFASERIRHFLDLTRKAAARNSWKRASFGSTSDLTDHWDRIETLVKEKRKQSGKCE